MQVLVLKHFFQGGFKTVIWADVFQTVVILAAILAILIKVGIYE